MWGIDIKDAFLTVDQRSVVYVLLDGRYYKVLKCLPGQRCAGAWWADQISRDLLSTGLKQNPSCPVAFGKAHGCCTIHVDDGFLGGQREVCQEIVDQLQEKYTLSVTGPISKPGERVRFLKRIFTITEEGILMQSDPKYVSKMITLLGIHKPRARKVPCGPDIVHRCLMDRGTLFTEHALAAFYTCHLIGVTSSFRFRCWRAKFNLPLRGITKC